MIYQSHVKPGFDCMVNPCTLKNPCTPDNSHGRHADQWHYVVIADDRLTALELVVYTDIYPTSSPRDAPENIRRTYGYPPDKDFRRGAWVSMHAKFTLSKDDIREDAKGTECSYLEGRCFDVWSSATFATEFFAKFGGPDFVQSEEFVTELKKLFVEIDSEVRRENKSFKWQKCHQCNGTGIVTTKGSAMSNNVETVIVTRHSALADYLVELGVVDSSAKVIAHASLEDVDGKHVVGVLPLALAAKAAKITSVDLQIPSELRGVELSLDQIRNFARGIHTYEVREF